MAFELRVLLLDPVKSRREQIARGLALRLAVVQAGTPGEAEAAARATRPHAVLATLRQMDENGLVVGRKLRELAEPNAWIGVHGAVDRDTTSASRRAVAQKHRIDAWIGTTLTPPEAEVLVWGQVTSRFLKRDAPTVDIEARKRQIARAELWEFLNEDRPFVKLKEAPRGDDEEPGWAELLNARPTIENLKRLFTKEIK